MPRLPVVPPILPDEALSSWIARIAARYDLSTIALAIHLLPREPNLIGMMRSIDNRPCPPLEAALADATDQPEMDFAACRFPGLAAHPEAAWPRRQTCWCPVCLFEDVAARGEIHLRRGWGIGAILLCTSHGCLLISECPRCLDTISYQPVGGRLRLWCDRCEAAADNVLEPNRVPFWPLGLSQQQGRCRTVSLAGGARQLLLRLQRTRVSALIGQHVRAPWTPGLTAGRLTDTLRKLCFIMLGPLWEDARRPPLVEIENDGIWQLPDDWTPGSLPPFIAAPALLASVTFLAAPGGRPLVGVTWNRQALLDGEAVEINAETLPWHLSRHDAMLARRILSQRGEAITLLLSILKSDRNGIGATREERRRRYGIRSLQRRREETVAARLKEDTWERDARERRAQSYRAIDRYALRRLLPDVDLPRTAPALSTACKAAVAVFATIGSGDSDSDIVHQTGWSGTRMESRYVQFWIIHHRDCHTEDLIGTLAEATDRARAEDRGLLLPDLAPRPTRYPWADVAE